MRVWENSASCSLCIEEAEGKSTWASAWILSGLPLLFSVSSQLIPVQQSLLQHESLTARQVAWASGLQCLNELCNFSFLTGKWPNNLHKEFAESEAKKNLKAIQNIPACLLNPKKSPCTGKAVKGTLLSVAELYGIMRWNRFWIGFYLFYLYFFSWTFG